MSRRRARRRSRRLGRGGADPARLSAAVGGEAHRQVARLPGDERRRRGRLRDQRLVARRLPSAALNVLWLLIGAIASWRIFGRAEIVDLSHVIERWHDDLQGPAGPAHLRLLEARGIGGELRRRLDLPDRPHRHGRQHRHLSRLRRSTAMPTARTWRSFGCNRSPTCRGSSSAGRGRTASRSTPQRSTGSTSAARRCSSTPAGTGIGGPTAISASIRI